MTAKAVQYMIESDFTAIYAVMVWIGVLLSVAWFILMRDDPANAGLPEWDLRLRRGGIVVMVAGFILSVLFGGEQGWAPWPTTLLTAFGFDFYLGAAIFTARRRQKIRDRLHDRLALDDRLDALR